MRSLTKELCKSIAEECFNRFDFQKKDCSAYKKSFKEGWLKEFFPEKFIRPVTYLDEEIREEALKFNSRNDFKNGSYNMYHCALRRGLLDNVCSHMETNHKSDENIVYLLKTDLLNEEHPVYKIGLTSKRCGKRRLNELKYSSGLSFKIVLWEEVDNAKEVESTLLTFGVQPEVRNFRGYTELRALSEKEVDAIVNIVLAGG